VKQSERPSSDYRGPKRVSRVEAFAGGR